MDQVNELLKDLAELKKQGLTAAVVVITFCQQLTLPIKERVHPASTFKVTTTPAGSKVASFPRRKFMHVCLPFWMETSPIRAYPNCIGCAVRLLR